MSITAKVKKRVIDTGRIFDVLVQGENRSHTIIFAIPNETMDVSGTTVYLKDCYFYLLYKRKGDTTPQIPLLLDKTYDSGTDKISASFEPTSYFTEKEGSLEIQVFACSTEESFITEDVDIEDIALWTTFAAQISISKSQLKNSQTIVSEDMFTKGVAEMSAYLESGSEEADAAEEFASDAEEFAKGTRSDGLTVPHASTGAHDNAKDYKDLAKDWASKIGGTVESGEFSAKYYAIVSDTRSQESEAYALGTKGGTPFPAFADKNAKDWATKTGSTVDGTNYSSKQYALNSKDYADIVSAHATAIDAIGDDLTNIDAVATDIQDEDSIINTVADNIQDVNVVAESITDVNTVAGKATQITTVAGIASNVTTVAGIASDVTAVAGIASDVSAVEDIKTDVSAVAAIDSDVSAVSTIKEDVSAVATIDDDVSTVATNISDVSAVADDITNVNAVADDLTNIDAVADDLTNIDNAVNYALEAEGFAVGEQNGVPVTSGSPYYQNNAKYYSHEVPDLKNALTAIDHRVSNLEQAKGSYVVSNYKDGSITPSGKGAWAIVEGLRGVSRVENNLVDYTKETHYNASVSISGTQISSTVSVNGGYFGFTGFPVVNGHKYLVVFNVKTKASSSIVLRFFGTNGWIVSEVGRPSQGVNAYLISPSVDDNNGQLYWYGEVGQTDIFDDFVYTDLNIYFNGTIPSDADTIAEIQQNYPQLLIPSDYGVRIVDSSYSGVRAWSRNIFDKSVAVANERWNGSITSASSGTTRSVLMRVKPSTTYYFKNVRSSSVMTSIYWFDINQNYISSDGIGGAEPVSGTKTSPSNACYVGINLPSSALDTCCVNISDSNDGTTTPYFESTLSLTFQGKSAGSVYDSCEPNVEVGGVAKKRETTRIATVVYDGSSDENWQIYGSAQRFYIQKADIKINSGSTVPNLTCDKLMVTRKDLVDGYDKAVGVEYKSFVLRIDSTITTVEQLRTWLTQNPVTINYELNTPVVTLSDPLLDNTLLTEAGGRMSTVQTGTVVDGSFDIGFITL